MSRPTSTVLSRRLDSRDRADHPGAKDERCQIKRPHDAHPYGRILPAGGLAYWCKGRA